MDASLSKSIRLCGPDSQYLIQRWVDGGADGEKQAQQLAQKLLTV